MARKSRWIATVAAAVLLFCAASAQAEPVTQASSPQGTDLFRMAMKDYTSIAFFTTTDATGCVVTTTSLEGSSSVGQTTGAPVPNDVALAIVTQYDQCQGVLLFVGVGQPETETVTIQPSLAKASLQFDTTIVNTLDGQTYPLHVDVTFTSTSSTRSETVNNVIREPGFTFVDNAHAQLRDAAASGAVRMGSTNLAPTTSTNANIFHAQDLLIGVFRS